MAKADKNLRLNQAIAKTGLCSRRDADQLIAAGRVSVNGQTVREFNATIDPDKDQLQVDGKSLAIRRYIYIAMHKPVGIVTTCQDDQGRETILDLLPGELRHVRPVGRLDMYSEGLLILTNDGNLTQKVTHPVYHTSKRYLVTVRGSVSTGHLKAMAAGVNLSDGPTLPAKVRLINKESSSTTFELEISEGRNRQIRRMCEHLGYPVRRLLRVSIGGLQLGEMPPGSWRYLTSSEVKQLELAD